jgi:hypothetical protein
LNDVAAANPAADGLETVVRKARPQDVDQSVLSNDSELLGAAGRELSRQGGHLAPQLGDLISLLPLFLFMLTSLRRDEAIGLALSFLLNRRSPFGSQLLLQSGPLGPLPASLEVVDDGLVEGEAFPALRANNLGF